MESETNDIPPWEEMEEQWDTEKAFRMEGYRRLARVQSDIQRLVVERIVGPVVRSSKGRNDYWLVLEPSVQMFLDLVFGTYRRSAILTLELIKRQLEQLRLESYNGRTLKLVLKNLKEWGQRLNPYQGGELNE